MPQNRTAGGRAIPRVSAGQAYLGLGNRTNKRMPPDYAKDLAYLMQVDPRDKAEMDKARKALEKAMRNIVSAGADYEAVLAELSKAQKANTGKDGKPKDLKELKEMRQELKEVLTVINKLSKRQAVSDESLATLSPLMKKLAESISAIKMGQLGTADLHAAMMASGAGKKTDVDGLAKIYKKNTELARKDWHTFMSQALKLQQSVGSRKDAISKELLTPFLGNTSPTVHTLKEMLGEDKSFYNAVKEYWSNSLKESQIVRRERETQAARFENQGEAKENSERMFQEETLEHDKVLLKTTKEIKSLLEDLNATATSSQILEATQVVENAINGGGSGADLLPLGTSLKTLAAAVARFAAAAALAYTVYDGLKGLLEGKRIHEWKDVHGPGDALNYLGTNVSDTAAVRELTNFGMEATGNYDLTQKYNRGEATVADLIRDAREKNGAKGVSSGLLATVLASESTLGLDEKAQKARRNDKGKLVGAQGIAQFEQSTLDEVNKKNPGLKADAMDPRSSIRAADLYLGDQQRQLESGKDPVVATDENTYIAYVLGVTGAKRFLKAVKTNPDAPSTETSNPDIFYKDGNKKTKRRTNREALAIFYDKVERGKATAMQTAEVLRVNSAEERGQGQFGDKTFRVDRIDTSGKANSGASVTRAAPIGPAPAPVQQAPASPPASPVGQNAENPVSIDSIPMFVDDTGLMLISIGGLV